MKTPEQGSETIMTVGRLQYRPGWEEVRVDGVPYDLRQRVKARLCIQFLLEQKAFNAGSARPLSQIDKYVRTQGHFRRLEEIRLHHYFNDRSGRLRGLRKALIRAVGRNGRFFLQVD